MNFFKFPKVASLVYFIVIAVDKLFRVKNFHICVLMDKEERIITAEDVWS